MVTLAEWKQKWYDLVKGTVFDINEFTSQWYLATVAGTRVKNIQFNVKDGELSLENATIKATLEKYPAREVYIQWRYYPCDDYKGPDKKPNASFTKGILEKGTQRRLRTA